jgi:hypothetical protein
MRFSHACLMALALAAGASAQPGMEGPVGLPGLNLNQPQLGFSGPGLGQGQPVFARQLGMGMGLGQQQPQPQSNMPNQFTQLGSQLGQQLMQQIGQLAQNQQPQYQLPMYGMGQGLGQGQGQQLQQPIFGMNTQPTLSQLGLNQYGLPINQPNYGLGQTLTTGWTGTGTGTGQQPLGQMGLSNLQTGISQLGLGLGSVATGNALNEFGLGGLTSPSPSPLQVPSGLSNLGSQLRMPASTPVSSFGVPGSTLPLTNYQPAPTNYMGLGSQIPMQYGIAGQGQGQGQGQLPTLQQILARQ